MVLIMYHHLFSARTAVAFLLLRQEEEVFSAALNEEEVIVQVQNRDGERDGRRDRLIDRLVLEGDVRDQGYDDPLNECKSRNGESTLHVWGAFRGLRRKHLRLLVSWHFYYVWRN